MEINFTPFPELQTERFLLRRFILADAPDMYYFRSDAAILTYLDKEPAASLQEAEDFIKRIDNDIDTNNGILWAITEKEDPARPVGSICYWKLLKEHYRAEIGYLTAPLFWGKGVMKEVIPAVLEYGFNKMGLHSVEARINPDNKASAAVLERAGFIKEAHFREDFFYKGQFKDTVVYSKVNGK